MKSGRLISLPVTTQVPLTPSERARHPLSHKQERGRNAVESPSPRRFAYGEGSPLRFG